MECPLRRPHVIPGSDGYAMAMARRGRPPHPDVLTPAEWRVLEALQTGATNAEIAIRLGVSLATVKFHVKNIRSKLDIQDRDDLAAWRPVERPAREGRRQLLTPLGLLAGLWKPVAGVAGVAVVGGAIVAGGVIAYAIANDGESAPPPDSSLATETATTAPTTTPVASPTPPATPTPGTAPEPAGTPTATEEVVDGEGPSVTFWGEVPPDQQDALRARVADIVRFYDERFDIVVPNLSIHIASDSAALETARGRALDYWARVHPADYHKDSIYVHATETANWLERLYFEAFADQVAGDWDWGPVWLREGAAMYMAHLFRHWSGEEPLADALALVLWAASYDETSLQAFERRSPNPSTATMAAEWLVERAGERALVGFYRALPANESWEGAFEETFGLSPQAAYRGFDSHRAEVLVVRRTIWGRVLGPDGEPIQGRTLFADAVYVSGAGSESVTVQPNGGFALRTPDGTYRLSVTIGCPRSSGELGWYELGWWDEQSGFTTEETEATAVVVDGESVSGIVIRLPRPPEEIVPEC